MDFTHLFDLNTIVGKVATGVVIGLGKIAYNQSKAYLKRVYSRRQSLLKNWVPSGVKSVLRKKIHNSYDIAEYRKGYPRKKTILNHLNSAFKNLFGAGSLKKDEKSNITQGLFQSFKKIIHGLENPGFLQTDFKKAIYAI